MGQDSTIVDSLNLNMVLKIDFKNIKVAHGLKKKSRAIIFTFGRLINHQLIKVMTVLLPPPVIVVAINYRDSWVLARVQLNSEALVA